MRHFNRLTPVQAEVIALIAEEAGEIVQACGKILRHGLYSMHPTTHVRNDHALERELGDLMAATHIARLARVADALRVKNAAADKLRRLGAPDAMGRKLLHHAHKLAAKAYAQGV